jgi:hypothetical protein
MWPPELCSAQRVNYAARESAETPSSRPRDFGSLAGLTSHLARACLTTRGRCSSPRRRGEGVTTDVEATGVEDRPKGYFQVAGHSFPDQDNSFLISCH